MTSAAAYALTPPSPCGDSPPTRDVYKRQEYISVEELQQATGVTSAVLESLRTAGVLADLPESSQVSFF